MKRVECYERAEGQLTFARFLNRRDQLDGNRHWAASPHFNYKPYLFYGCRVLRIACSDVREMDPQTACAASADPVYFPQHCHWDSGVYFLFEHLFMVKTIALSILGLLVCHESDFRAYGKTANLKNYFPGNNEIHV